jgi:hypothetical protein
MDNKEMWSVTIDLTSRRRHVEKEEIVTAWQIPESRPTDEQENEAAVTAELGAKRP